MIQPTRARCVRSRSIRSLLLAGIGAVLPLAMAQAAEVDAPEDDQTRSASEIVVQAEIGYGNRGRSGAGL